MSVLDLLSGFNQIYLHPAERHKLASITPRGHYESIRLGFGWLNGPAFFQREYDVTLGDCLWWGRLYIDNLTICDTDNHKRHDYKLVTILYNQLRRGIVANAEKTELLCDSVTLLGMKVDGEGVLLHFKEGVFSKLKARKYKTVRDLQRTLGTLLWYMKFILGYSLITKPILNAVNELALHQTINSKLDLLVQPIIQKIENQLAHSTKLIHPDIDVDKIMYIQVGKTAFVTSLY